MLGQLQGFTGGGVTTLPQAAPMHSVNVLGALFTGTETVAAGLFTTLIVLFYLLVAGETFLRRVVEILPHFDDKRHAVQISMHIERDISVYLISVTLINALVGLLTLAVMWGCGVANLLRALGHFPEA
jgi:predicted PurR-regulated permease PerM